MQTLGTQDAVSRRQPRLRLIGYAAILAALVLAGVWFGTRHRQGAKPASQDTMSSMSGMAAPVSAPAADA